ncbi:MAG: MoaD/ThiS family protein [Hyphomicrobiales bacterium]
MRITVKTGGLLGQHLPEGSERNRAELDIEEGSGPIDVMRLLGMPEEDTYMIILNDAIVPTAERPATVLSEKDELGIFPPLKGG